MEPLPGESRRTPSTKRDPAALSALPAARIGGQRLQVADDVVNPFQKTRRLNFVYLPLHPGLVDGHEIEPARTYKPPISGARTAEIAKVLARRLDRAATETVRYVQNRLGNELARASSSRSDVT